jgi:hypothetical protein
MSRGIGRKHKLPPLECQKCFQAVADDDWLLHNLLCEGVLAGSDGSASAPESPQPASPAYSSDDADPPNDGDPRPPFALEPAEGVVGMSILLTCVRPVFQRL